MEKLVQLQKTLREIENGTRLERLDSILVRQVLQQAPAHQASPARLGGKETELEHIAGKDAYRTLLELRKNKKRKTQADKQQPGKDEDLVEPNQQDAPPLLDPKPALSPSGKRGAPALTTHSSAAASPEPLNAAIQISHTREPEGATADNDREMLLAIQATGKALARSHQQVEKASAELQALLAASQALLPSQFLFERNLKDFCQERSLEVIQSVLLKFQHRFYRLYFAKWWSHTLELRLAAHQRAVATIVRVFRGHCGRKLARRVRFQLAERQLQARKLLSFRITYREHQALKLQMVWRKFIRRRAIQHRQQLKSSAVYLQRAFRNRKLKRSQLVHTLLHAKSITAAIVIQRYYRGYRTRKLVALRDRQSKREALVAAILARNVSNEALMQWKMDRRGAAFLICSRALYPFAMRRRMRQLVYLARRQRAAQVIARRVCLWFGVSARREQAAVNQLARWLQVLAVEQKRSREAAVLIQKHLRRWVQRRKFVMVTTRRKKLARKQRIADKELKMRQVTTASPSGKLAKKMSSSANLSAPSPSPKAAKRPKFTSALKAVALRDTSKAHEQIRSEQQIRGDAVAQIQSCYRSHVRHTRFLRAHWRAQAAEVEKHVLRRREAAIMIQKHARGAHGRRVFRRRKAEKRLYAFMMAWKWKNVIKFARAARKIYRWIQHKRTQQIAQLWRLERRRQQLMATRIQRAFRGRLVFKCSLAKVLAQARRREEIQAFCSQSLQICTQHLMDELIFASLGRPFEDGMKAHLQVQSREKSVVSTGTTTTTSATAKNRSPHRKQPAANPSRALFFPMMQMVFLVVSGAKDPSKWRDMDEKALLQTKLERSRVVALFKAVNKHYQDNSSSSSSSGKIKGFSSSPKAKSKATSNAAFFSMTDVDLALAKAGGASKRALTFEELAHVLRLLAEMKLSSRVTLWWSKYDGSDAQLFTLLWEFVFVLPEMAPLVTQLEDFVAQVLHKRCLRIQQLLQRGSNLKRGLLMRLQLRKDLESQAQARAVTILQTRVRVFLAKRQLRLRIQQVYEKYIDPDWGMPYWTNPVTGFSTWAKPRALRAEDVSTEVVPYPQASLMLKIPCEGEPECVKCAEWFCFDCQEFFCAVCLPTFHKDGRSKSKTTEIDRVEAAAEKTSGAVSDDDAVKSVEAEDLVSESALKKSHEMEKITLCGLCQFQVASRKCLSCLQAKPGTHLKKKTLALTSVSSEKNLGFKNSSTSAPGDPEREALFCDVCFAFVHRRGALQMHKSTALLEMCQMCAVESDEAENQGLQSQSGEQTSPTKPTHQLSIKIPARTVQYECESCDANKRVCGKCVTTGHPIELCGDSRVHKIPIQTLMMLERARRIAAEIEARDRADVEKMKMRALQAKRERMALRIQKFWRSKVPILRARHIVTKRKLAKRERWLQVKEDAKREKQLVYLLRNLVGLAKPLQTDTEVKKRLREMNALQRRQLTIRARMFGLLAHEYMRVGIPLPGVGRVLHGSQEILTTEDLRGWVKNRQTIRLKRIAIDSNMKKARALENLSSWYHLSTWDHGNLAVVAGAGSDSGSPEGVEELLVDVDAKEKLTERKIPLARPLDCGFGDSGAGGEAQQAGGDEGEEAAAQEHMFVMYLVEYSMDPRRVVWINHSLAERFWAWKRQKALDRKETQRRVREEKERKARADADAGTAAGAGGGGLSKAEPIASADQHHPAEEAAAVVNPSVQPGSEYWNYEYPSEQGLAGGGWAAAPGAAAAYDGYDYSSSAYGNYEYGYGYNDYTDGYSSAVPEAAAPACSASDYYSEAAAPETAAAPLVDSSGYFYAPDGNSSAWQGYDYDSSAYASSEAYYSDAYSYSNGTEPAYPESSVAQGGDASNSYYQSAAEWGGDGADYYATSQQQQQQTVAAAQGYDSGFDATSSSSGGFYSLNGGDGYTDHHSRPPYYSTAAMDGGDQAFGADSDSSEAPNAAQKVASSLAAWEEVFDPQSGQVYYANRVTQQTAWELPSAY